MTSHRFLLIPIAIAFIVVGCGPSFSVYYVKPLDWKTPEKRDSVIQSYAPYVKGWKIYLDPGHGGEDRFNHGPAFDVIEADLNLRVGLRLAEHLRQAGATVFISRSSDTTVKLTDRPKLSEASGADFFVSIHHNAVGHSQDPSTNFTSVWYHAREGDPEYHASNQDIARYIQRDLAYAMGNSGSPATFDGTLSDYNIYQGAGFAVLRLSGIPAVLIEGSFFSSAYEEQRLAIEEFNDIEAWGTFKGIARYLKAGIPHVDMLGDSVFSIYRPLLRFQVFDSLGIDKRSVIAKIDNVEIDAVFRPDSNIIEATPPEDLANGVHSVDIIVRNKNGNANFPLRRVIAICPPVDSLVLATSMQQLAPDSRLFSEIMVQAFDVKRNPCADGTIINLTSSSGKIPAQVTLQKGLATCYFQPDTNPGIVTISASASGKIARTVLSIESSTTRYCFGEIRSWFESTPIGNVPITMSVMDSSASIVTSISTTSYGDGKYLLGFNGAVPVMLQFKKDGYFVYSHPLQMNSEIVQQDIALIPLARGVLLDKIFALDARYGGSEDTPTATINGSTVRAADINLQIARRLQQLLTTAGARVLQVRKSDIALTDEMRTKYAQTVKGTLYIRIDASTSDSRCGIVADPSLRTSLVPSTLLWGLCTTLHRDSILTTNVRSKLSDGIPYGVLSVLLPGITDSLYTDSLNYVTDKIAWGIYRGLLQASGYQETSDGTVYAPGGSVTPYKKVVLDNTITCISATNGSYAFYGVDGSDRKIHTAED